MIRVAVIGVGVMGANHARVLHANPRAQLVAVVDADAERAASVARKHGCASYTSVTDMLDGAPVDAACVATPTAQHVATAAELLRANVHVLVEKPLAPTRAGALELCQLARTRGRILMVGHIERFNPAVRRLHELIGGGVFGDVTSIITRRVGLAPSRIRDVDVITDLAVHDIDVANFLMGRLPVEVYAHGGCGVLQDRFDFAEIFLNYGNANAVVSVNWLTPIKIRKMSVTGTRGYAELDYVRQELMVYLPPQAHTFEGFSDFLEKYGQDRVTRIAVEVAEPLGIELDHFLDCVVTGRAPEVGCEAALAVLEVTERAAARQGWVA